jgi:tRNA(fMet)-specific endonuclease VapC
MKRYLLDTGIAADFIFRRGNAFPRGRAVQLQGARIGIGLPTVGELLGGAEYSSTRSRNLPKIQQGLADLFLWPFDRAAAGEYGRLYSLLKRGGRPMQQIDMQLAAIALSLGSCAVVTKDSDFAAIPGLSIVDWS